MSERCCARHPEFGPGVGADRQPCSLPAGHSGAHENDCARTWHGEWNTSRQPREIGGRTDSGKRIMVVAESGGVLERAADVFAVETADALSAVIGAILEADRASGEELAAFVPVLHASLVEVTQVAARTLDRLGTQEPASGFVAPASGDEPPEARLQGSH
ncbi:hypothetical protein GCM10027162_46540 [Streptomyces incanus]